MGFKSLEVAEMCVRFKVLWTLENGRLVKGEGQGKWYLHWGSFMELTRYPGLEKFPGICQVHLK